jgi:hypothetical protein
VSDSPVSLIGEDFVEEVGGSFTQPLTDPGIDPTAAPLMCVHINQTWKPLLAGAALQLLMPASWEYADDTALNTIMDRAVLVLEAIAFADYCPEYGMVSVTITAGTATATVAVVFPSAFAAAPVVVVSGSSGSVVCSAESISSTGFTARITADVELLASHTETVYWQAAPAS